MEVLMEFLKGFVVLLVMGVCLCVGIILKHLVPTDKINKFIPLIMGVLGVLVNVWLNGFAFTPEILLGGLASGLAATGAHQAIKQLKKKRETESKDVNLDGSNDE